MKQKAEKQAEDGLHPTFSETEGFVASLMREAALVPFPASDVVEFYAREMMGFIKQSQA